MSQLRAAVARLILGAQQWTGAVAPMLPRASLRTSMCAAASGGLPRPLLEPGRLASPHGSRRSAAELSAPPPRAPPPPSSMDLWPLVHDQVDYSVAGVGRRGARARSAGPRRAARLARAAVERPARSSPLVGRSVAPKGAAAAALCFGSPPIAPRVRENRASREDASTARAFFTTHRL